jgi:hypothetical protein
MEPMSDIVYEFPKMQRILPGKNFYGWSDQNLYEIIQEKRK